MTLIATSKYLEFKSTKSPSGSPWFYVRRTNDTNKHDSAVVITTLIKKENGYDFLLFNTNRPPLNAENKAEFCVESPAGLIGDIDKNEEIIECAIKELKEEAGFIDSQMFLELTNCSTSSGLSSETLSFVTAIVDKKDLKSKPINDGGIIVERFLIDSNKITNYILNLDTKKYSLATATVTGIFFALERIKKLTK